MTTMIMSDNHSQEMIDIYVAFNLKWINMVLPPEQSLVVFILDKEHMVQTCILIVSWRYRMIQ